jgi:selenocysteine-specific elongation factor
VDAAAGAASAGGRLRRLGGGGGAGAAVAAEAAIAGVARDALAAIAAHHEREPLAPGISREALRALAARRPGGLDDRVFAAALEALAAGGQIAVAGDVVRAATFSPTAAAPTAAPSAERVLALFAKAGLAPPWLDEVPRLAGLAATEARAAIDALLRRGDLVRVRSDLHFDRRAIDDLRARLVAFLADKGQITAQEWKALVGQSRKYAIPLAEHFDAEKLTIRVGEIRKLRGRA